MLNEKKSKLFKGFGIASISILGFLILFINVHMYGLLFVVGVAALAIIFTSVTLKYRTKVLAIISYTLNILFGLIIAPYYVYFGIQEIISAFSVVGTDLFDIVNNEIFVGVLSLYILISSGILLALLLAPEKNVINYGSKALNKKMENKDQLENLFVSYQNGMISEEEYNEKRKVLMEKM